ncbi:MAG: divalent cation tolerance protein CutA [Anaerolineales bacterium]|nr:MAG: divalent cation tolerance protein CutA [Anaerolineales bacterium]
MPDHEYLLVSITTSSSEEAARIAEALVQERLAACVNIVPAITSIYRWQGEVHRDSEVLLIAKSRPELFESLAARVKELHSYEVPEIIALPIAAGSKAYLNWIDQSVQGETGKGTAMNLGDIKRINQLFAQFYPYLARQIANAYGREDGLALEIGPYGPGISIELTKLCPGLRVIVGDGSAEVLSYLEEKVAEASLGKRIKVKELDKFDLPFATATFDLVVFRGGLFFWEDQAQILREIYRVLKPSGVAVVGGGFGAEAPNELIEARAAEIRELNRHLGKRTLSEAELGDILGQAGLTEHAEVERRHGLWLTIRK